MKNKFITVVVFLLGLLLITSCGIKQNEVENTNTNSQQLEILRTDLKLTQDQVMSQIKAEHLIENKGYLDDDKVVVFVNLKEESLIETYNDKFSDEIRSLSEFAKSPIGQIQTTKINNAQASIISNLYELELIDSVENTYNTITNSVAINTTYANFLKIKEMDMFKSVTLSDTFNKPLATDASAIVNPVDVYETGIYKSDCVEFTGKGTAVAVLDSGFDMSHTVFQHDLDVEMIKLEDIEKILSKTNAANSHYKGTSSLKVSDVYYSKKIPFAYDYADKDNDVFPYDSEHGTHVAGIIGGKDDTITGIAIDTQLVLLKVFPDLSEGGKTENILAALEDAVLIGVDAINLSLGSSCGFAREEDGNFINDVYDRINESGISLITAASNSYSSAFGGDQGNTPRVTNPDSGTVGSPSTYGPSLSVASISGTKSNYIVCNNEMVLFYTESNSVSGKPNEFYKELYDLLGKSYDEEFELEYVTIPGVGKEVNFLTLGDLTGKIALVKRGDNTFEEKAKNAKAAGCVACIIYNNIEGEILMSMGKSDHIPTISISKELGTILASKEKGVMKFSYDNAAGPFMSDFSSWGPTPNLGIKPEITAHGGNIKSAVPGGSYDEQSGTSMATPNLCGIVVLIRQYLKETYPTKTTKEISVLTNQLLMSTATIVLNQDGNPYSPRKQGAGLASIYNAVNTKAYLTVDGIDRPKLELLDDPTRSGVYEMVFNVENLSKQPLKYDISLVGMTESVSISDKDFIAEKSRLLTDLFEVELISGGSLENATLSLKPSEKVTLKVTYKLSNDDISYLEESFPYGMYVEGFVKLKDLNTPKYGEQQIDLNIPFLAYYGDWMQAPIFDKTYYEVESEAHDQSINEEDKIKADYLATTPYGSYFYNYIIPFGTYLYDIDTFNYDPIPASKEKIAISNYLGTIDGISAIYGGLLRGCRTMTFTITDKQTNEVVFEKVDYNAHKAYSNGGTPYPYYEEIKAKSASLGLVNNKEYEFRMIGELDYKDGGLTTNARNSFGFNFYADDEAPVLKNVEYTKEYDKTLKKDRYYLTLTVYDNHYAQSITPIIFTSTSSYTFLTENPIPIYSERNSDTTFRIEITNFLENIHSDSVVPNALAFSIDDYALNSNIYICQLPGTKGDFKFTTDGDVDSSDLIILSVKENEVVDLTKYLSTKDKTVDENKDYLKYLVWTSSNEEVATVNKGLVKAIKPGRVTISVEETLDGKKTVLILNVKESKKQNSKSNNTVIENYENAKIESIKFSYFDTTFAFERAAQTSEIGQTGSRIYLSSLPNGISLYPGEKLKLHYNFEPWYAEDNYKVSYVSKNPKIATIDENGNLTALKKGSTIIELKVEGSNIMASVRVTVKSEFVIENRTLIAYKGIDKKVVIPDDEGILYIGAYAFSLYEVDNSFELTEDDYDANKIPQGNTSVEEVIIPEGVEIIHKYAFHKCSELKKVVLPSTIRFIREYAFFENKKLESINLTDVEAIGAKCFSNCINLKLNDDELKKVYSIGQYAFENCDQLTTIDLTGLRNTGQYAFKGCSNLNNVLMNEYTKLSVGMFSESSIPSVDIYAKVEIPANCFEKCENLTSVTIHNDLISINRAAFRACSALSEVNILSNVLNFGDFAFSSLESLTNFKLPNNDITFGQSVFYDSIGLETLEFDEFTNIKNILGVAFEGTNLKEFKVHENNQFYKVVNDIYLTSKDGKTVVFAAINNDFSNLVLSFSEVGPSAFTGCNVVNLTFTNKDVVINDYAFADCKNLTTINFANNGNVVIGKHAFNYDDALVTVNNFETISSIGDYAFANTKVASATFRENAKVGEGAFFRSHIENVKVFDNVTFGLGAFQEAKRLETVTLTNDAIFGIGCFAYCSNLKTINLENVTEIIEQAFYGCTSLQSVDLSKCKKIGNYAFSDCNALSLVTLNVVESIGDGAFSRYSTSLGAPRFTTITLPDTLNSIGEGAFLGCEKLEKVIIPDNVSEIKNYTFSFCKELTDVVLNNSIKTIGEYAFSGCENLYNINLENIEVVKDYSFTSCKSLSNINLDSMLTIGLGAFADTNLFGVLNMPKVEVVKDMAFQGCQNSYIIAPNLKVIGVGAFQNNKALTSFKFSNNIESLSYLAFNGCEKLKEFRSSDDLLSTTINDYLVLDNGIVYTYNNQNKLVLMAVPQDLNTLTLTVLPNTVRIETYAGNGNPHIQNIILPESLEIIGNYAFYEYSNLKQVEFKSVKAPILESSYNSSAVLNENDPGYELLKNQFDIFELYLAYYQFIDLVGKQKPINFVLPLNDKLEGYDSIVYLAYFGKVEDAKRGTHLAKEINFVNFEKAMATLKSIDEIVIEHEELINNAITWQKAIKQDPLLFGYTKESWDSLTNYAQECLEKISEIKIKNSNKLVKDTQALLPLLPTTFSKDAIDLLNQVTALYNLLTLDERRLLDFTNYNALIEAYDVYLDSLNNEVVEPIIPKPIKKDYTNLGITISLISCFGLFTVVYTTLKTIKLVRKGGKK